MIRRIAIEHYRSITHFEHDFSNLTLVVGPNASGKSNFVDALRFVRDAAVLGLDRAISERYGIDSIREWSPSRPFIVTIRVDVESPTASGYLKFSLASKKGNYIVRREEAAWNDLMMRKLRIGGPMIGMRREYRYTRTQDGTVDVNDDGHTFALKAEQPSELFLTQFEARRARGLARALGDFEAYAIYPNTLRAPQRPSNEQRLSSTGDNLTSILRQLSKSKAKRSVEARAEILASMRLVMPDLAAIRIQSVGGLLVPIFRVRESDGRLHDFNVSQISDGTLRVLGLLTAAYQPFRPATIAMEEPEQTVNPGILGVLADTMKEISQESQLIVTTHSPELLDRFSDPDAILAVENKGGRTVLSRIDAQQRAAVRDRLFSLGELLSMEGLHG